MAALLPQRLDTLDSFEAERVLSDGSDGGTLNVLGRCGATPVLLKLARLPLPSEAEPLRAFLRSLALSPRMPYSGAEYGFYAANGVSVDVIAPHSPSLCASDAAAQALLARHVERATAVPQRLVRETPALYAAAHAPHIASIPAAALSWVYKILAKEKEVERLLLDVPGTNGFLMNTDPKWASHPAVEGLYCLALVHSRDIASLRSLRGAHLPLLRALRAQCLATIEATYGVEGSAVRAFVHYPPQFYHLHVHFTSLNVAMGCGCFVERAHLLDDIIDNLERDASFYETVSLTVRLGQGDALQSRYAEAAADANAADAKKPRVD